MYDNKNKAYITIDIPLNALHHIHKGLTVQMDTNDIIMHHGKPHNECHVLVDRAAFVQDEAAMTTRDV